MAIYTLTPQQLKGAGVYNSFEIPAGGGSSFASINSFEFDGTDDYIETTSTFSLLDGQSKASFSLWVKPTLAANAFALYIPNTLGGRQCTVVIYSTGMIRHQISASGTYVTTNTGALTANVWQHILVTTDLSLSFANRGKIFVNGVDATSGNNLNLSSYTTSSGRLTLAGEIIFFEGLMDEVAVWSGTDLRSEVSAVYNGGIPGDLNNSGLSRNPDLWYRMGENATWTGREFNITDAASSNNGITNNMAESAKTTDVPS